MFEIKPLRLFLTLPKNKQAESMWPGLLGWYEAVLVGSYDLIGSKNNKNYTEGKAIR